MSVKTSRSNGKNISGNIEKLKLEHLLYTYVQFFDNFVISLPDETEDTCHSYGSLLSRFDIL